MKVQEKVDELELEGNEKIKFFLRTLDNQVKMELKTFTEFEGMEENFEALLKLFDKQFSLKERSEFKPLLDILNIKQISGQDVREFMSEIRMASTKLSKMTLEEKESLMLKSFINGLIDKRMACALKQIKPQSMENAYEIIKKEKLSQDNTTTMREVGYSRYISGDEKSLTDQLSEALKRIHELEKKVRQLMNEKQKVMRGKQNFNKKISSFRCFNCNKEGHIVKNCQKPIQCKICGKKNHISANCRLKNKETNLRNVKNDTSSVCTEDISLSHETVDEFFSDENQNEKVFTIRKERGKLKKRGNMKYTEEVEKWNAYINGRGKRPETVISQSNSEKAKNKPVVSCEIEGETKNVLFDSGCEGNIIDKNFLKKIAHGKHIKILPVNKNLKCANNTLMNIEGYVVMSIKIGTNYCSLKFAVTEIFPNVIIGLKSMKKENIAIIPALDAIMIDGIEKIPFVSKTEVEN